jgi:hypothetical protein
MGQTTHQIEAHIEDTRDDLSSNLHELERKVKSVTDWRLHFKTNPMTMLGVAFGGGILLATTLRGRRNRRRPRFVQATPPGSETHAGADRQQHQAVETWENIKTALIGVAATRAKDFVDEIVPGFREQFQRAEQKTETSRTTAR